MSEFLPRKNDYQNVVVNKPWGYEYLIYQNSTIALWYLSLKPGARTSLHCHTKKKTGLILLSGEAIVSFLNDSMTLKPLSKLMIRPGLFHSTAAVSPDGAVVIEVETPSDKTDLVRLEDKYGRFNKPYEGLEVLVPLNSSCIKLASPQEGQPWQYSMQGCILSVEKIMNVEDLRNWCKGEILVILEGALFSSDGASVLGAGDVVAPNTLCRLAKTYSAPDGISLLSIEKQG